jgi:hypothetical protein
VLDPAVKMIDEIVTKARPINVVFGGDIQRNLSAMNHAPNLPQPSLSHRVFNKTSTTIDRRVMAQTIP